MDIFFFNRQHNTYIISEFLSTYKTVAVIENHSICKIRKHVNFENYELKYNLYLYKNPLIFFSFFNYIYRYLMQLLKSKQNLHSPGYLHFMTPISSNSWQATFFIGIITVCIFSESVANIPNLISCPSVLNCHL